ncbi:hypothetical protein CPLU01_00705 [Colletotrichum plurivorum]|uniref:Uncharacterized protein n=1 Tax=Colletotrichum plurivorum TaxID=2175906 RepID=A0A8H6NRD3_9PEZI|nr:hypothetical protein CPLU01_00705 [Colletotrichum plurivorum]
MILLPMYDNQALTSWTLPVSFNAIVSTLGAISRASLAFAISACISQGKWNWYRKTQDNVVVFDRFEEASRGPWGSLRLLWWTKFKTFTAIGALTAVILIGFEPFLQAIVTFSGEWDLSNIATIGKTQVLDAGNYGVVLHAGPTAAFPLPEPWELFGVVTMVPEYDFGALAAIWEGFSDLSSTDIMRPNFNCSTGNCTWPPFASLAVCSSCNDISSLLTKSEGSAEIGDPAALTIPWKNNSNIRLYGDTDYMRYSIPQLNLNISNRKGFCSENRSVHQSAKITARATCRPDETISFGDLKTLIISHAMLQSSQRYRQGQERWNDSVVTAEECALYFCTNIYKSEVKQGVLEETVLKSYSNRNLESYTTGFPGLIGNYKAFNQNVSYSLYNPERLDSERIDLQLVISKEDFFAATKIEETANLHFNITYNTTGSLIDYFVQEFSRPPADGHQLIYSNYPPERPPIMTGLGASTNVTKTFENVAASLTKWMRNRSLKEEPFTGVEKRWVVRIRVNWEYLILPIFALLGGCVFCLVSITETRGLGLPAWRGSALATLAYGLDAESRALLRGEGEMTQLEDQARALEVKFVDSEKGPQLVHEKQDVVEAGEGQDRLA